MGLRLPPRPRLPLRLRERLDVFFCFLEGAMVEAWLKLKFLCKQTETVPGYLDSAWATLMSAGYGVFLQGESYRRHFVIVFT